MTTSETSIHRLHVPLVSLSVCSCFYFLLTRLCLVCPCPSVLKPSRVLPLISPSVCDSTFCQRAQAAVQSTWLAAHRGGMDAFPKALFFGSRDPCRDGDRGTAFEAELQLMWGKWENRGAHTHTQTQRDVRARRSFFNTRTLARTQATATHLPQAGKKKTDGISCQLQKRLFPVFRPAKANRACHNSRTAFCEFIFMTAPSNCWGN